MLNILVTLLLLRIAYIDYKTRKIPDKLNLAIMVCGLISCIQNTEIDFIERMIGFLIVSVPMYMICLMIPEAFGGGDIKLTADMGFWLETDSRRCIPQLSHRRCAGSMAVGSKEDKAEKSRTHGIWPCIVPGNVDCNDLGKRLDKMVF